MLYPDGRSFVCKYCNRKFEFSVGSNAPRLIEHLLREHMVEAEKYGDLYLSDLIKTCYEIKGGAHDGRGVRVSAGY